jgi:predicted nucleic-acid-binding protein
MKPRLLDANVLLRHFTGIPTDYARRATAFLRGAPTGNLLLLDVLASEVVFVLQKSYRQDRATIGTLLRSAMQLPAIRVDNLHLLWRSLDLYERRGMDWADAYMVAAAESRGLDRVVSFDRFDSKLDGLSVRREEP